MKLLIVSILLLGSCASGQVVQDRMTVDFKRNSYYFKTNNLDALEEFVVKYKNSPLGTRIKVNGHRQSDEPTRSIAFRRAMATKSVLIDLGVDPDVIVTQTTKENKAGSIAILKLERPVASKSTVPAPLRF